MFRLVKIQNGRCNQPEPQKLGVTASETYTLGEALVRLKYNGHYFKGRGLSTDVIEASIFAYIDAVNKLEAVVSKEGSENEN